MPDPVDDAIARGIVAAKEIELARQQMAEAFATFLRIGGEPALRAAVAGALLEAANAYYRKDAPTRG